jgi:hypothetical protein
MSCQYFFGSFSCRTFGKKCGTINELPLIFSIHSAWPDAPQAMPSPASKRKASPPEASRQRRRGLAAQPPSPLATPLQQLHTSTSTTPLSLKRRVRVRPPPPGPGGAAGTSACEAATGMPATATSNQADPEPGALPLLPFPSPARSLSARSLFAVSPCDQAPLSLAAAAHGSSPRPRSNQPLRVSGRARSSQTVLSPAYMARSPGSLSLIRSGGGIDGAPVSLLVQRLQPGASHGTVTAQFCQGSDPLQVVGRAAASGSLAAARALMSPMRAPWQPPSPTCMCLGPSTNPSPRCGPAARPTQGQGLPKAHQHARHHQQPVGGRLLMPRQGAAAQDMGAQGLEAAVTMLGTIEP